jgi:hypothetical protein
MLQRIEAFRPGGIPIEDHLGEVGRFQVGVLEVHIPPVRREEICATQFTASFSAGSTTSDRTVGKIGRAEP